MTSVTQWLEKLGGGLVNQTGCRWVPTRPSLSEAQDFRGQCRQPGRKAECLTCGKAASRAAELLVASNIQTHQKPLLPGVAPGVPQLLLKPKPTLLGLETSLRNTGALRLELCVKMSVAALKPGSVWMR